MPLGAAPVSGGPPGGGAKAAAPAAALTAAMSAGQAAPGAAPEAANAQLEGLAMAVREIGDQVKQLVGQNPTLAAEGQQIGQLLKLMIVKAAQQGQMQTMSGASVPGAGGGGV